MSLPTAGTRARNADFLQTTITSPQATVPPADFALPMDHCLQKFQNCLYERLLRGNAVLHGRLGPLTLRKGIFPPFCTVGVLHVGVLLHWSEMNYKSLRRPREVAVQIAAFTAKKHTVGISLLVTRVQDKRAKLKQKALELRNVPHFLSKDWKLFGNLRKELAEKEGRIRKRKYLDQGQRECFLRNSCQSSKRFVETEWRDDWKSEH